MSPTTAKAEEDAQVGALSSAVLTPTDNSGGADTGARAGGGADGGAASVAIERRRATVAPGERLPVLLKFCALRPAAAALTASAVKWAVFRRKGDEKGGVGETRTSESCDRVWVSHRLEGKGRLLHATLEQRAAK